ncbi:type II toxin-antitoxin system HicB family antitoxin [Salidesulfovibrio brasiliensis]
MRYIAVLKKEKRGFGVTFPDFPDCVTFGADMDEAVDMANEALSMFALLRREAGETLPEPRGFDAVRALPATGDAKLVGIELDDNDEDFEEVGVTFHKHLLERIDRYCTHHGVDPADFLSVAAREAIRNDVFK